jgi:hypothetical protein
MPIIRRVAEKTFKRKIIGRGSAGARCCFQPLAEYLMLQKYLDLRPPLFRNTSGLQSIVLPASQTSLGLVSNRTNKVKPELK